MNSPENNNFDIFNNDVNQFGNIEKTRQPSPEEIREVGSVALTSYGPNGIFVERQAQEVQEPVQEQEGQIQEASAQTPEITSVSSIHPEDITSVIDELEGVEWHKQPVQNVETPIEATSGDINEAEVAHESLARRIFEKAKGSRAFKKALLIGLAATMMLSSSACKSNKDVNQALDESASEFISQKVETTNVSGELSNGLHYDYSNYADREGKESANAYDYDMSDCYGNREAFVTRFLEVAGRTPEALASYAYTVLEDDEKQTLGIKGMTMSEIDYAMSNGANGGVMQSNLLKALEKVLWDEESTQIEFYLENDYEYSSYIYFEDDNQNDVMEPPEMHIAKAQVKRNGAPQADIKRARLAKIKGAKNSDKVWVKKADVNLRCGGQVNGDIEGVPVIDPNNPNPNPQPPTQPKTDPQPQPSTEPELDKKNQKAEIENASDRASRQGQNNPTTSLEQDKQNFDSINDQQKSDDAKRETDRQTATEQAQKESEAKKADEQREHASGGDTAAADTAAEKARADAEEAQRKAAEAERAREAQRQAAAQAQAEADAAAAAQAAEAASNADASASERANMYENGDF